MGKKLAYKVGKMYYSSEAEAAKMQPLLDLEVIELGQGQAVVQGQLVTMQYKVQWNTQEIPFWANFEGAKACVLAINTNKNGNRARLLSFMKEKEVQL